MLILSILLFTLIWSEAPLQKQLSALEIVQRADDKVRGKSNQGEMVMRIVRPTWKREIGLNKYKLL